MVNRRQFISALSAAPLIARAQSKSKPNLLFILADDLGYGDLGCYGQKRITTPNLDRLASEGMLFHQAYSGSTVCAPSRCSLMTGKHTGHTRVRGNVKPEVPLTATDRTVAELFKSAGYHTGLFGKWGLGQAGTQGVPNMKGFDEFFGYHTQLQAHTYYPHELWENDRQFDIPNNWGVSRREYAPDLILARATRFLQKNGSQKPFFMEFSATSPHANNELGRDTGNGMEVPDLGRYAQENWPAAEKGFAAMVSRLDRDIGQLLDTLKQTGAAENTLVIFTSDNGPHSEGGHHSEFFDSNGPLRGIKRDLYEGGIRVPFLARWPGVVQPGSINNTPIAFWDLLPTSAEVTGLAKPVGTDGVSFLPLLRGGEIERKAALYWEFHEGGFNQALRFGDWKAIRFGKDGPIELYDLKSDIGEKNDIAAAHPEIIAKAKELFASSRVDSPHFPVQPNAAPTPDRKAKPPA